MGNEPLLTAQQLVAANWLPNQGFVALPKALGTKVLAIMGEVKDLPMNGYNEQHGYPYVMAADALAACRAALVNHSVLITPQLKKVKEIGRTKSGIPIINVTVRYTILDVESGEFVSLDWKGTAFDSADKAIYKALTGCYKYFLINFFMLPTDPGADPESTKEPESGGRKSGAQGRSRSTATPKSQQTQKAPSGSSGPAPAHQPFSAKGPNGLPAMKATKGTEKAPASCQFCGKKHIQKGDLIVRRPSDGKAGLFKCYSVAADGDPPVPNDRPPKDSDDLPFDQDGKVAQQKTESAFNEGQFPDDWRNFVRLLHPADVFLKITEIETELFGDPDGADPIEALSGRNDFRKEHLKDIDIPDVLDDMIQDGSRRAYLADLIKFEKFKAKGRS